MRTNCNQFVGIVCLSILLHIGINAQNVASPASPPASLQNKAAEIISSSDTSSSNSNQNNVAVATVLAAKSKSDVKTELVSESVVSAPKLSPKNAALNLKVAVHEAKMDATAFGEPDLDVLGEPMTFHATAYALKGRTRSGSYVRRGVIAADPRVLPLGSVVQIKAGKYTGVYTVHDTGGRIKGNIIDVWMPTNKEARQFGRRKIKLHVLKLGPKRKKK